MFSAKLRSKTRPDWLFSFEEKLLCKKTVEFTGLACNFFLVDRINFPSLLPTGALLGCVDVVDCLGQEEYREQFPDGDSDSPFVFICTNPQELLVKFPMTGNHKICESSKCYILNVLEPFHFNSLSPKWFQWMFTECQCKFPEMRT